MRAALHDILKHYKYLPTSYCTVELSTSETFGMSVEVFSVSVQCLYRKYFELGVELSCSILPTRHYKLNMFVVRR